MFLILAGLLLLTSVFYLVIFVLLQAVLIGTNAESEFLLIYAAVFTALILLIFLIAGFCLLTGLKLFKKKPKARMYGIISGISVIPVGIAFLSVFPIGTFFGILEIALGIYSLWFFFSAQGKQFFESSANEYVIKPGHFSE